MQYNNPQDQICWSSYLPEPVSATQYTNILDYPLEIDNILDLNEGGYSDDIETNVCFPENDSGKDIQTLLNLDNNSTSLMLPDDTAQWQSESMPAAYATPPISPGHMISPFTPIHLGPLESSECTYPFAPTDLLNHGVGSSPVHSTCETSNWEGKDCFAWARSRCRALGLNSGVSLEVFRHKTVPELLNKTEDEFVRLLDNAPELGRILYNDFQKTYGVEGMASHFEEEMPLAMHFETKLALGLDDSINTQLDVPDWNSSENFMEQEQYQFEVKEEPHSPPSPRQKKSKRTNLKYPRGKRAAAKSPTVSEGSCSALSKIDTKNRNRVRGPKTWEFLIRLLTDKKYNPSHIKWEDESQYTFRLVKQHEIAALWGQRQNNGKNICYDNFARGLRYHYTTGGLKDIPEKQLVYQCGPKAIEFYKNLKMRQGETSF